MEGKGLFGLAGSLTIQPEHQRNYIYASDVGANGKFLPIPYSIFQIPPLGVIHRLDTCKEIWVWYI